MDHLFFLAAPVWVLTAVLYIALAAKAGAREAMEEVAEPVTPVLRAHRTIRTERVGRQRTPAYGTAFLAVASLVLIVFFAWCTYENLMILPDFQGHLLWLTMAYFVAAVLWVKARGKDVEIEEREANPTDAESDQLINELHEPAADIDRVAADASAEPPANDAGEDQAAES